LAIKSSTRLPVGAPVDVEIEAEEHKGVVLVSTIAIVREGEETAVFVVAGNKAERRTVTLGVADADHTELKTGVKAGETIIIDGQAGLPDGATVTTDNAAKADDGDGAASPKTP
jgi:hypothetical protein